MAAPLNIVTLCTGNAARSVILGYMLTRVATSQGCDWSVRTAGTHVVEGSAMSARTRDALLGVEGLGANPYGAHRSHQVTADDVGWADVILASEASQVFFVRSNFVEATDRAVSLHQFVRQAPLSASFVEQLREVSSRTPSSDFDVADPAGGDQVAYDSCATTLWALAQQFGVILNTDAPR